MRASLIAAATVVVVLLLALIVGTYALAVAWMTADERERES